MKILMIPSWYGTKTAPLLGSCYKEQAEELAARGRQLELTEAALQFLVERGFDKKYGARSLKRAIREYVEDPLCDVLLDHPEGEGLIRLDVGGDTLTVQADNGHPADQ